MKPNEPIEDFSALRQTLREWKVDSPLPRDFRGEIWRQIARPGTAPTLWDWRALWAGLETLVVRPRYAAAYIALLLLLGIFGGYFQARETKERIDVRLSERYVQSIDPYRKAHP